MTPEENGSHSAPSDNNSHSESCLLNLPPEILEGVFERADLNDLFHLSLVCRSFQERAAALLYRDVSYVFNDENLIATHRSLDRFTAMLETLNTSDQKYTESVKAISINNAFPVEANGRPSAIINKPVCDYNSGRFLNTLLVSTVKKLSNLESFRWDVRLEVTPSLFTALSKLPNFHSLHIHLQAPKPLGSSSIITDHHVPPSHHHHYQPNHVSVPAAPSLSSLDLRLLRELNGCKYTRTLSLFSGLKSLAVLDIDSLGHVQEIAQCISASSSSLRTLKLSFSEELALKARKKAAIASDPSDSESASESEEFGEFDPLAPPAPPPFPNPTSLSVTPSVSAPNDPEVRRERVTQEKVLALLFGLDLSVPQIRHDKVLEALAAADQSSLANTKTVSKQDPERKFVRTLRLMSRTLPLMMFANTESSKMLRVLMKVEKATDKYLELREKDDPQPGETNKSSGSSNSTNETKEDSKSSGNSSPDNNKQDVRNDHRGLHDNTDGLSEIVDIEHPDETEDGGEDQEFVEANGTSTEDETPTSSSSVKFVDAPSHSEQNISSSTDIKGKQPVGALSGATDISEDSGRDEDMSLERYIRDTHGLPLESLSIHLIPVSSSVLCRAVDISTLKHLSLLNVGPQRNLWSMMKRIHQVRPLQLTSIHTDNVTPSFLTFVNSLEKVTELFMIERSSRSKVESFAAKTTIEIREIRREILKKHVKNLKRLMIRNDEDSNWALDPRTARLIALSGSNLVELAIGLTTSSFHYFMQQIGGLKSLIALQVFYYHPDLCSTVLRALRSCIVDHILHYPALRIEYVAMCYSAAGPISNAAIQVKARVNQLRQANARIRKREGKIKIKSSSLAAPFDSQTTPSSTPDESDGDEDGSCLQGLEVCTRTSLRTSDISGVKIWEKDIWGLQL